MKPTAKGYCDQIDSMAKHMRQWMKEHPGEESLIQWPRVVVLITVQEAVKRGLLKTNPAAKSMLDYVCAQYSEKLQPTCIMLWSALQILELRVSADNVCPSCGAKVPDSTGVGRAEHQRPEPGSISVCLYCLNVAVFDESLKPQKPSPELLAEILAFPEVKAVLEAARKVKMQSKD